MTKKISPLLMLVWLLASHGGCVGEPQAIRAQTAAAENAAELKQLEFLLGEWQGTGWIEFGPNQRHTFRQTESVQRKAGGSLLLIEGLGLARQNEKEVPVHQAFAVISSHAPSKQLSFRAWRAGGEEIQCAPTLGPQSLIWGFTDTRSQRRIRFTIKLNAAGQWFEIGEIALDDQRWHKFFEMTLSKVK